MVEVLILFEILEALKKTISFSILVDFERFAKQFPPGSSWYVLSDYCLDDKNKTNDVWTFSILLNHDSSANIKDYVKYHAPKDLKDARTVSEEFLAYLNSPLIFHFSFMLRKSGRFLIEAIRIEEMKSLLEELRELTVIWGNNVPETGTYWSSVRHRINEFLQDTHKSGFNQKLGRQVLLTGLFAGIVFYYLWLFNAEPHVAWVSDRDSIIIRYNGVVYDLAFIFLALQLSEILVKQKDEPYKMIDGSKFYFVTPEERGTVFFDEMIRIPDYIAGTLATAPFASSEIKEKHRKVILYSLVNSTNHAVIQLLLDNAEIVTRRLKYVV